MVIKTETIVCTFIGDFKVGDNMQFNAGLLCKLNNNNEDGDFNKLVLLQAVAIVEAALAEILYRAKVFTKEGVVNISADDLAAIRTKEVEKFAVIVDVMKKHKLLDAYGADVYEELHKLRKYRNKVHIQIDVDIAGVPRDEDKIFTDGIRDWSLKFNVAMLKFLNKQFPRPDDLKPLAHDLTVPSP